MKQDLPLSYPDMLQKYLEDRINENKLTSDDDFDKITHGDNTYELDVHVDEEIVRIVNTSTNQLWNITKWDTRLDYKEMDEILELLSYLEQETKFTVRNWVEHYTKQGGVYSGALIDIYCNKNVYDIVIKSGGGIRLAVDGSVSITGGVKFVTDVRQDMSYVNNDAIDTTETGSYTNSVKGAAENLALNILNAEYSMSYIQSPVINLSQPTPLNKSVFEMTDMIKICGLTIAVDKIDNVIKFNHNDYNYVILNNGTWHNNKAKEPAAEFGTLKMGYYGVSLFMRYNTSEEKNFVRGVISLLNEIAMY